jgi:hypothetical protein
MFGRFDIGNLLESLQEFFPGSALGTAGKVTLVAAYGGDGFRFRDLKF